MRQQEGEEGSGRRHVSEVPPETLQYLEEVGGWALWVMDKGVRVGAWLCCPGRGPPGAHGGFCGAPAGYPESFGHPS